MTDTWKKKLSNRSKTLRPSPIREILEVVRQPGMISFAGGMPAPEIFPVDKFFDDSSFLKAQGDEVLQYGTTEGDKRLRDFIAHWQEPRLGRVVDMSTEMLITTGSQQVIDLIGWSMLDPGDYIIVEDPTYLSALSAFSNHGARFATVPMDGEGMIVSKLPEVIERLEREGHSPKFLYTIVNFQNPAGATLSVARRKELAAISEKYGLPIVEDDPYGYVRYDGDHLPSIFSFDKVGNTVYSGSFSKILAPGTRIGWASGNADIIRQMAIFKQFTDICSSSVTQALVYEYCRHGYLDTHLPTIIDNYRKKRDAMQRSMEKHLSPLGVTWVKPEGGFFFWPDFGGIDVTVLSRKALEKKVAFIPAEPFCVDKASATRSGRLNFTYASPDVIEDGISRLAEAVKELKG